MDKCLRCETCCYRAPLRHVVSIMCLFFIIFMFSHRQAFSVAIVEMVQAPNTTNECKPDNEIVKKLSDKKQVKYKWDESVQSYLLAMFYIGYVPGQFFAGFICDKYGARRILLTAFALSTILTFLVPVVVKNLHWGYVAAFRAFNGLVQCVTYPGVACLINQWILPSELGIYGGIVFAGFALGMIFGNYLTAQIIAVSPSWEYAFYAWGVISVFFWILFFLFVYSTPYDNKNIHPDELDLIHTFLIRGVPQKIPICAILKDGTTYGLIAGQLGINFTIFSLASNLPKYLNNVLRMGMTHAALASSFPYLAVYIVALLSGYITDLIRFKYNVNVALLRKSATFVGSVISVAFYVAALYGGCNRAYVLTFITFAFIFHGLNYCGAEIHCIEVTRNHGSFLMSIGNGIGACAGFICPLIIGAVAHQNTFKQWINYGWIIFGLTFAAILLYMGLASGKRRKWDYSPKELEYLAEQPTPQMKWYMERSPEEHVIFRQKYILKRNISDMWHGGPSTSRMH